jgi:hypothetical protein
VLYAKGHALNGKTALCRRGFCLSATAIARLFLPPLRNLAPPSAFMLEPTTESIMLRGGLLWLLGIPIPALIILWLLGYL